MEKETHREHSEQILGKSPATPCAAWHLTFGGRCLNCGFNPEEKMEETKEKHHTPGPWNTGTVETNETRYVQPIFADTGQCLGVVYGEIGHKWTDEHRQNARLIAAAPDLLAASRGALNFMVNLKVELGQYMPFAEVQALEAAIAKAEGMIQRIKSGGGKIF